MPTRTRSGCGAPGTSPITSTLPARPSPSAASEGERVGVTKRAMAGEGAIARIEGWARRPGEPPGITGMWSAVAGFPRLPPRPIGYRGCAQYGAPTCTLGGDGSAQSCLSVHRPWHGACPVDRAWTGYGAGRWNRETTRSAPHAGAPDDPARSPRPLDGPARPRGPGLGPHSRPLVRPGRPRASRHAGRRGAGLTASARGPGAIGGAAGLTMPARDHIAP